MSQKPIFSIITICRNHCDGLQKTHKSLQNQTFIEFEWIVIDGASTDNTLKYLKTNKPDILQSEPDNGPFDAMNKGITHAKAQYTLFLNAGDMLATPNTLEQINRHITENPNFLYGDSYDHDNGKNYFKGARSHNNAKRGMFTHHQSMIYKTAMLQNFRYDTRYKIAADYDLTLGFIQHCKKITRLHFPISIFETGGISQRQSALGRQEQKQIRARHNICSGLENTMIAFAQYMNLLLRRFYPRAYWFLKRASRP